MSALSWRCRNPLFLFVAGLSSICGVTAIGDAFAAETVTADGSPARCLLSEALVDDVATAAMLHARGVAKRDPMLLVAAARLRIPVETACSSLPGARSTTILSEAETLTDGDAALAAIVAQTQDLLPRGSGQGLNSRAVSVAPAGTYRTSIRFKPRETALVYAESAGAEIALAVDGIAGRLCKGRGPRGQQLCRFTPQQSENVQISVNNVSDAPTLILLITN